MKETVLRRLPAAIAACLCLVAGVGGSALAEGAPDVPNMIGHWGGLLQTSVGSSGPVTFFFDLNTQNERIAQGTFGLGDFAGPIRLSMPDHGSRYHDGKLLTAQDFEAESDYFTGHIKIKGTIFDLGGGQMGMRAGYVIGPPGTFTDVGSLITVQDIGGIDWKGVKPPSMPTCWTGAFTLEDVTRAMTVSFNPPLGSSLTGEITLGVGVTGQFAGTISDTGLIWGVTTLPGRGVVLITFTGQVQGGILSGTLHYVMEDNSTMDASFLLFTCSFEDGP